MPRGPATADGTITTTEKAIFQSNEHVAQKGLDAGGLVSTPGDGDPASEFEVSVSSSSTATLRIRIPGLHASGQYAFIRAGEIKRFIYVVGPGRTPAIHVVYASTASGTATFDYTVSAS